MGDVKLLVGVGLLAGAAARCSAASSSARCSPASCIVVLLAARRITLGRYVPFGPFLIVGAIWAVLVVP